MFPKIIILFLFSYLSLRGSGSVRYYSLQDLLHSGNVVAVVTPVSKQEELDVRIPYRDTNGMDQTFESKILYTEYRVNRVLALRTPNIYSGVGITGPLTDPIHYISSREVRKLPNSEAALLTHTIRVITQRSLINMDAAAGYEMDQLHRFPIYYSLKTELQPKEEDSSYILICTPNYRYNSFETVGPISIEQLDEVKRLLKSSKQSRMILLF